MGRCVLGFFLGGLLLQGCYSGSAPMDVPADHPSAGDPHAGLPSRAPAAGAAASPPFGDGGGPVDVGALTMTAPAGWPQMPPSSSFVAAEFTLPRAKGDDADGRLTLSTAGGTVEANLERWQSQFDSETDQPPPGELEVAGLTVTVVDLSGNFNDQRGPFAPAEPRADYRMIAAVVPVDGQLHFIKAVGPEKTMAAHADQILEFIRTVRRKP